MDSIVDELDGKGNSKTVQAATDDEEEIIVPKKCAFCKNNTICSVLPTFIGLNKIGIIVSLEVCPFNLPQSQKKLNSQQQS